MNELIALFTNNPEQIPLWLIVIAFVSKDIIAPFFRWLTSNTSATREAIQAQSSESTQNNRLLETSLRLVARSTQVSSEGISSINENLKLLSNATLESHDLIKGIDTRTIVIDNKADHSTEERERIMKRQQLLYKQHQQIVLHLETMQKTQTNSAKKLERIGQLVYTLSQEQKKIA